MAYPEKVKPSTTVWRLSQDRSDLLLRKDGFDPGGLTRLMVTAAGLAA